MHTTFQAWPHGATGACNGSTAEMRRHPLAAPVNDVHTLARPETADCPQPTIPNSLALICSASTLEKIRHCASPPPKNHRPG
jgi:hypothetical protein